MADLHIHPSLARFSDNQNTISLESASIEGILPELCQKYPKLKKTILDENGELNPYVNLYVNGESIREQVGSKLLQGTDKIELITALVGG